MMKRNLLSASALLWTSAVLAAVPVDSGFAQSADAIAAVQLDCSAFRPLDANRWVVTKTSIVLNGPKDPEGKLPVMAPMVIAPKTIWPNGVDLIDVLNRRCRR